MNYLQSQFSGDSLGEKIAYDLRIRIISGEIKKNTVVSENQIASEFGTSRSPVREALKELDNEGLIRLERMGAVVLGLTTKNLHELYDVRLLIEKFAIQRVVKMDTKKSVETLSVLADKMEMAVKHSDYKDFSYYDLKFHDTIVWEADHTRIYHLWKSIRKIILAALLVATEKRFLRNSDELNDLIYNHRLIINALSANDPDLAEQAIMNHFEDTRKTVGESVMKRD